MQLLTSTAPMFGGETYDPALDGARMNGQLLRVWNQMIDGQWHTLAELADKCGGSEAAISARIRDFRKEKFGSHIVLRRRVTAGLWEYSLRVAEDVQ